MTAIASASYSLAAPTPDIDTLAKLRAELAPYRERPLVVTYAGKTIASGYHVTEVKAARLSSLDCGANPETWSETVIQLWDVTEDGARHMKVGKFLDILWQVERRTAVDPSSLVVFEVGDSVSPMQVFTVGSIIEFSDHVEVSLAPRPATCKPRERGLALAAVNSAACCGTGPAKTASCCA